MIIPFSTKENNQKIIKKNYIELFEKDYEISMAGFELSLRRIHCHYTKRMMNNFREAIILIDMLEGEILDDEQEKVFRIQDIVMRGRDTIVLERLIEFFEFNAAYYRAVQRRINENI